MRRLTITLLAACLASLVTGQALAQPPSSDPTPVPDRQLFADIEAVIVDDMDPVASGYWSAFLETRTGLGPPQPGEGFDGRVHAKVGAEGLPPGQLLILQSVAEDGAGHEVIIVDGISAPGASAEALVDGIVAWAESEWRASRWDRKDVPMPPLMETHVDGKNVFAVVFAAENGFEYSHWSFDGEVRVLAGDVVEYIYASGSCAIKVLGQTEDVIDFLGRLP